MRLFRLRAIRLRFFCALALLALLAVSSFVLERRATIERTAVAKTINDSGRQRMLSQRIAFLAGQLQPAPAARRGAPRGRLLDAVALMRRSHRTLVRAASPAVARMYAGPPLMLDERVLDYLRAAEDYARDPDRAGADVVLAGLEKTATDDLLPDLDAVVARHQTEAEAAIVALERLQILDLVAVLCLLLATGLLIFMPMLRRIRREIAFKSVLEQVATAANEATSIAEPLGECLQRMCALAGWPIGHAYLLDQGSGQLVSSQVWHLDETSGLGDFREATEHTRFAPGVGLPGRVLESGEAVWIADVTGEPNFPRVSPATRAGIRTGVAFPLLVRDRVVGVIEFFSRSVQRPDYELIDVMSHLGAQLGRVIERHQAEEQLTYQAGHDALTGLPNRALLLDRLSVAAARAHRSEMAVALIFIDVDNFKPVNDTLGHHVGDALLVELARRLDELVRGADTVARLGGDEFVVLCDELADDQVAVMLATRICEACRGPVVLDGKAHELSVSVGVAVAHGKELDADQMLRDADLAMYRAKELGGNQVELFDRDLRDASDRRAKLELALRSAQDANELGLVYQPIVNVDDGKLTGFEALLRWSSGQWGPVGPDVFIPIAECSELIGELGQFALAEACRQASGWQTAERVQINVNLSARQVADPGIAELVRSVLDVTGLEPALLGLELTETALLEESETTEASLRRLKALGVRLVLDDFGTGYSSLGHLRRFPIDELKIDRSFVGRMCEQPADFAIVGAIIGLAASLGMNIVAEGVETQAQVDALRRLGCDKLQGYLIDVPLTAGAATARLATSITVS